MKRALLAVALLSAGCVRPDKLNERVRLSRVEDETQILVACLDDGVHFVTPDGKCVGDVPEK